MNALYMVVLCLIQSAVLTGCCSVRKINLTVDNASILCTTDRSCVAECYRGFIFSSGKTKQSYSCLNGVWSPVLSTCKRIPAIYVTYSVIWKINNVVPSNCSNVSKRLLSTAEMLEERLSSVCSQLTINSTVNFTYSMNGSLVNGQLIAEYSNFTSMFLFETCISFVINSVPVKEMLRDMFKNISCNDISLNYEVKNPLSVDKRDEYCNNGTQVHFVRAVYNGNIYNKSYCDFAVTETTTPMTSPNISSKTIGKKTTLTETDLGVPDTDGLYTYETNTHDMNLSNNGLNKESSRDQVH
ncbi:uncharacterized protein LOC128185191 [Crassostrea angulata]|uniref:uncharacterized protein LOC128185191 n=1 Tax=Magallana angulata TaxID=2784310 RepID=UPI0022B0C6FB|nr:uncharacterized protein LOC128185191 [Crassostrea angulata]